MYGGGGDDILTANVNSDADTTLMGGDGGTHSFLALVLPRVCMLIGVIMFLVAN